MQIFFKITILLLVIGMSTISCQNQNEIDELITTSVTDDIPIKSLPPTSRV